MWFSSPEYATVMLCFPGFALDSVRLMTAFPSLRLAAGRVSFPILTVMSPVALSGTVTVMVPSPLSMTFMSSGLVGLGLTVRLVLFEFGVYLSLPLYVTATSWFSPTGTPGTLI